MSWICLIRPHRWAHICNVTSSEYATGAYGLWQCLRCKMLKAGRARLLPRGVED